MGLLALSHFAACVCNVLGHSLGANLASAMFEYQILSEVKEAKMAMSPAKRDGFALKRNSHLVCVCV